MNEREVSVMVHLVGGFGSHSASGGKVASVFTLEHRDLNGYTYSACTWRTLDGVRAKCVATGFHLTA